MTMLDEKIEEKKGEKIHPVNLLRTNWKGLVLFQLLYRLTTMVIFFPTLIYIERLLLVVNGSAALTQTNFLRSALNPFSWLVVLVMSLLMTVFIEIEQLGTNTILYASFTETRYITAREAFDNAVDIILRDRSPKMFLYAMLYVLLIYPFSDLLNNSSITRFIVIPGFIREYVARNPVLAVASGVGSLVLGFYAIKLAFTFHVMTAEGKDFEESARLSMDILKGRRRMNLIISLVSYTAVTVVTLTLLTMAMALAFMLGALWLDPGISFDGLMNDEIMYIFFTIPVLISGWCVQPVMSAVVASRYYQFRQQDEYQFVKYTRGRRHTLQHRPVRIIWSIFCVICIFFSVPNRYRQFRWILSGNSENTMIMAHRGYSGAAPENTIPAFQAAIDAKIRAAELDVQMTRDGVIVVMHDDNTYRVTGKDLNIWEVDYDDIKDLDAGSYFGPQFAGTHIPTLEEVIRLAKGRLFLNIEIKRNGHDEGITDKVVQIIRDNNFRDECDITSLDYNTLVEIHRKYPDIMLAYTSAVGIGNLTDFNEVQIISLQETFVTFEVVEALHLAGKKVFVWTVNESDTVEKMVALNVDAILTNEPEMAQGVLARNTGFFELVSRLRQIFYYLV